MLTAIITTRLLRAGFHTGYLTIPPDEPGESDGLEFRAITDLEFDPVFLELAVAVYVPSLGKCVEPGNDEWPEDPATGLLTTDVLLIEDMREIDAFGRHWFVETISEGSWEDVKANASAICDVVLKSLTPVEAAGAVPAAAPAPVPLSYHYEFVGLWQAETSRDWETGHVDLDGFSFIGEGRFVMDNHEPQLPVAVTEPADAKVAAADKPMWTLESAAKVIQALHPIAYAAGWNLHLGGGVLMNGSSNNDLDILAVPRSQVEVHNRVAVHVDLAGLCPQWTYHTTTFLPDRVVDAYVYDIHARVELIYLNHIAKS